MDYYPKDTYEKLEFDRIVELTKKECLGSIGIERCNNIIPSIYKEVIETQLDNVWEYVSSFERNDPVPFSNYEAITEDIYMLRKEGYVLTIESIRRIYHQVSIGKTLKEFFATLQRRKLSQGIYQIFSSGATIDTSINEEIDDIIDEDGEVRPDASEDLLKIHKKIVSKEKELSAVFGKVMHHSKSRGLLSESAESLRNGRRVLTVPAENKRKIQGMIHDESATGKTVYIEPQEVIPINNEIYNLYTEKKKEVYKILKDLSDRLRPHADEFLMLQESLAHIDFIRAKARVAILLHANRPNLQEQPTFSFKVACNPILKLKFESEKRKVVPFDLELVKGNRVLVISGPNAGGKSVTLKTIGLLQLMLQCGFLVTADPNSTFGIFDKIFVDIGDQQSLEDDLSTYSSHLQNLKHFTSNADKKTLVLIDEFGTGTDPKIGGAIAESVLRWLNRKGIFGAITTHYSNLKYFAFKTKGIVNGSMEFNQEELSPTFNLKVGKPGSSFAYEIATKTGLPKEIISYAKYKTGKNEKAVDELLVTLQAEKKETEEKLEKLMGKENRLNKLIKNYEQLHKELEFRRKKLKISSKEQALAQLGQDNKELQKVVREIKEGQKLDHAKALATEYKEKKLSTISDLEKLKEEVYYTENIDPKEFAVGSYAKMRTGDSSGEILSIKKGVAELQMGFMKVRVPIKELVPAKEPIEFRSKSVKTQISTSREGAKTKLDVRGYTKIDAEKLVEEFMDNALIYNVSNLEILHGIGNGILRKAIHKKLKEYRDVKQVSHPEEEYGGKAVTLVKI